MPCAFLMFTGFCPVQDKSEHAFYSSDPHRRLLMVMKSPQQFV